MKIQKICAVTDISRILIQINVYQTTILLKSVKNIMNHDNMMSKDDNKIHLLSSNTNILQHQI